MKHKHRYSKGFGAYCIRCGKYKYKERVVKKAMQDKAFRLGGGLLLIGFGCVIGMGILAFGVGNSFEHRVRFVENSISAMVRPVEIIKEVNVLKVERLGSHRHHWFTGKVISQSEK